MEEHRVIRVLYIEDNPLDVVLVQEKLAAAERIGWALPHIELKHVNRLQAALARLERETFDGVLSDLDLPDSPAEETIASLRQRIPHMPIVVLTGREDEALAQQSVRAGVQDYLFKAEATGSLLARTMMYAIERQQVQAELEQRVAERTSDLEAEIAERRRAEEQITRLTECFSSLGPDARENIDRIVRTAGEILGGACLLYNRLDDERGVLCTWSIWQEPDGYVREDDPEGHICYDVIAKGGDEPVIIQDLTGTIYESSDPNVRKYGLRSYLGYPVRLQGEVVGSFCLCDVEIRQFSDRELRIMGMLAEAVATEEERRGVQDALRESEQRYRQLVDLSPDLIAIHQDGKFVFINQAGADLIGFASPEEILGKPVADFVVPSKRSTSEERIRNLLAGDQPSPLYEQKIMRADGTERQIEVIGIPFTYEGGAAVQIIAHDITDKVRAESQRAAALDALRQQNVFLETLLETIPAPIFYKDTDGRYQGCNRAFEVFAGWKHEEIVGRTVYDIAPQEIARTYEAMDEELFSQPGRQRYEWKVQDGQGRLREVLFDKATFLNEEGQPQGLIGVITDITARVRAEERLAEMNRTLVEAERLAEIGHWIWDPGAHQVRWSAGLYRICGRDPADGVPSEDSLLEHIHPDDRAIFLEALERSLTTGEYACEYRVFRYSDGRPRYLRSRGKVMRDADDRVARHFGVVFDVTERKVTEGALRESESRLKFQAQLLDSFRESIVATDLEGRVLYWGTGAEALYGYRAEEVMGDVITFIVASGEEDGEWERIQQVHETGSWHGEYKQQRKDGSEFWADASISLVTDEDGEPSGLIGIDLDITDRKRAEEELARYAEELEHSNQELEEFAHVASHDLREPLRSIGSFARLLADRYHGQLDDDADVFIGSIMDGVERMRQLLRDLQTYSLVGSRGEEPAPTESEAALGHALDALYAAIEESGAEVTHDPLPTVWADEIQVTQLFQNLIGNALKFRAETSPRVHISARRSEGAWVFSVRDNGIGIAPEHHAVVFEPFRRLHTQDEYSGTGMGLAICAKIVARHGGRMWVESAPGEGATFYFTLPDATEEQA